MRPRRDAAVMVVSRSATPTLLALVLIGLAGHPAAADDTRTRRSIPYNEARETFRRLGYRPYLMPGADICDPGDPRCFPELEYCAKSRTWACTYTWRRGTTIIEVETRYDNPVVARSECVVNCGKASVAAKGGRALPSDENTDKLD